MFTGVIKLAQIDDYISPSQNCIQPKIMKKDNEQQKATVTLNDCLACSGCITSAQSILIQQMSINKFIEICQSKSACACKQDTSKSQKNQVLVLISPQALLSLSKKYQASPDNFMFAFETFLRKNFEIPFKFFNLSEAIEICHELIFEEFITHYHKKQKKPIICSECPGWVCYAQKTLTKQIVDQMSKVKSPQQILGRFLRKIYGADSYIVSIAPCYDKKLEAIRFEIEAGLKEVDLTLASVEVVELINKMGGDEMFAGLIDKQINKQYIFNSLNIENKEAKQINFLRDQTSNGYIESILRRIESKNVEIREIRNADFQEYTFEWEGVPLKMAKCYGFRNIQKIVQAIKKGKCPYQYIQMMACPGGCFSGGGQVRYESIKNKQIVEEFKKILENYQILEKVDKKQSKEIKQSMREGLYATYSPIQKTLEQSVMNW